MPLQQVETTYTDQLRPGDLVLFYGNVYRLLPIGPKLYQREGERLVYGWPCEWVSANEGIEPMKSWDYFQGNDRAPWSRIVE